MLRKLTAVSTIAVAFNVAAMGPDVGAKMTRGGVPNSLPKLSKLIRSLANQEISRRAAGLRVLSAGSATNAANATNATNATNAVSAGVSNSATTATTALTANRANAATVADNATFATSSNTAVRADTAGSANTAVFAASANPVMYAKVSANGEIDPAFSKGISQGNLIFFGGRRGKSCFSGLPPIKGGVATVDALQTPNNDVPFTAHFTVGAPGQDTGGEGCEQFPETQFGVATYGPSVNDVETQSEDIGYFIVVYQ